jgi:hypothetical protein
MTGVDSAAAITQAASRCVALILSKADARHVLAEDGRGGAARRLKSLTQISL